MKLWKFGWILETGTDSWLRSVDQERLPFAWNFQVGFWGQMEQFNFSGKNGSKYDAVPFVKSAPVELGRLGWLVPRLTKSSTVGEIMLQVRFLQMVQLILVISVETKKAPSKAFLLFRKSFTGLTNHSIWHFIRKKWFFGTNGTVKHPDA